ncbi:MAG: formimidoylglutamase [Rubricoccaceae bacterium]
MTPAPEPHGVPAPATAPEDPRLGHWLAAQADPARAEVVLVGFPSDAGVGRNGGRVGAAHGPRALREALYRLTPDARLGARFTGLLAHTADVGDVPVSGDVEADQAALGRTIAPWLAAGKTVVVLGGGHETAFGHLLGYGAARPDVLNLDAHLDVRPVGAAGAHSGSPFRQALETGRVGRYTVLGAQPHSVAAAHAAFVEARGGRVVWREAATPGRLAEEVAALARPTLATLDLDAVRAADAPGVSAPNPDGLAEADWLAAAEALGRSPHVRSLDIVELCPPHDVDGRTARLAALTVWRFLRGRAEDQKRASRAIRFASR